MNYIKTLLAIFVLAFLMIGAEIYQSDIEKGIERDIYNYTEKTINIPSSNISSLHPIEKTKGIINQGRLFKIIESGINFFFVSVEQVTKMGIEYGYQNPNINWAKIFKFVIIFLVVGIVAILIKPIGYIIIFLIMLIIMIKEKINNKRQMKGGKKEYAKNQKKN